VSRDIDDVEYVRVDAVLRESERAILCKIDKAQVWVPKSVIGEDSQVRAMGDKGTLAVARWFAEREGLE
jgi:hypothetical protein